MEGFIKPADLFKKRRVSGAQNNLITASSFSSINVANHTNSSFDTSLSKSCLSSSSSFISSVSNMNFGSASKVVQSPMKCLNNITDPSPTKKLPVCLKNPFNQPVKRRLQLGNSPMKRIVPSGSSSTNSSPRKSPVKKSSRLFEMNDEDANLEPPKMKNHLIKSPRKKQLAGAGQSTCYHNDWTLRTKLNLRFPNNGCQNWSQSSTTTHKRHSGNLMDEDTPSKVNDKTISLEAIKNAATVYQHPYLPWQPLFPRKRTYKMAGSMPDASKQEAQLAVSQHPGAMKAMFQAWCESVDDLVNLLIDGKCPFFYLCSDLNTMLFKKATSYHDVQVFITPLSMDLGIKLTKHGIEYKCDIDKDIRDNIENTDTNSCNSRNLNNNNSNSQSDFNTSSSQQNTMSIQCSAPATTNDEDEELGVTEDDIANESQLDWLNKSGITDLDFRSKSQYSLPETKKAIPGRTAYTIGLVEGSDNIRKFIRFLQTDKKSIIYNIGEFKSIPPTLISPREFRLSTPQYPEVKVTRGNDPRKMLTSLAHQSTPDSLKSATTKSKAPMTPPDELRAASNCSTDMRVRVLNQSSTFDEGIQDDLSQASSNLNNTTTDASMMSLMMMKSGDNPGCGGPRAIELKGAILPDVYRRLHKLLTISNNSEHACLATQLDSTIPLEMLKFPATHR